MEEIFKVNHIGVWVNLKFATLRIMEDFEGELYCPNHKFALTRIGDHLICIDGHNFAITQGIPRFTSEGYSSAFGYQWGVFSKTQFDSHTKSSITKKRALEACGDYVWNKLRGSTVLEVGCGAGGQAAGGRARESDTRRCSERAAMQYARNSMPAHTPGM